MFFLKRYFKFSSFLIKLIFFVFLHQIVWIKFTKQICCKISNFSDIDLDISNISRLFLIGESNLLIILSEKSFQIAIFFNNWFGDPFAEFIKSSNFNFEKTWTDGRIAPVLRIQNLWAQSIINGTPVIPGLCEGLASHKVCEAIRESSKSGLSIKIWGYTFISSNYHPIK